MSSDMQEKIGKINSLISNSKNPVVFFDSDSDGATSYIQLFKFFKNIKRGYPISKSDDSQREALNYIDDEIDLIIFLDTPYIISDFFEVIEGRQVVWIDHHKLQTPEYLKIYEHIFYFNPLDFDERDNRSVSYFVYKVCEEREDLLFWATLGSLADFYLLDIIYDLYNKDRVGFNVLLKLEERKRKELFKFIQENDFRNDSVLDLRSHWTYYLWYETGFILFKNFFDWIFKIEDGPLVMRLLRKIAKLEFVEFKSELLSGVFENFDQIYKEYKKVYEKVSKVSGNLVYVEHKNTSISFNRQISEELCYRLEGWRVIFCAYSKDEKDFFSCSFRGNNFDVEKLLTETLLGLEGRGGGHKFAAGCIVARRDFEKFKKRVEERVNKP